MKKYDVDYIQEGYVVVYDEQGDLRICQAYEDFWETLAFAIQKEVDRLGLKEPFDIDEVEDYCPQVKFWKIGEEIELDYQQDLIEFFEYSYHDPDEKEREQYYKLMQKFDPERYKELKDSL